MQNNNYDEAEKIINATDIVALVSKYVKLEKQGKNYKFLPCFFVALYRPVCPIGHIVYL